MPTDPKILTLLQVVVPPGTPLSVATEVKILELLGIVSRPDAIKAMQFALILVPPNAPATLQGLVQLLSALMRMHHKIAKDHDDGLTRLVAAANATPNVALTFGTFLPICESLLRAAATKPKARVKTVAKKK